MLVFPDQYIGAFFVSFPPIVYLCKRQKTQSNCELVVSLPPTLFVDLSPKIKSGHLFVQLVVVSSGDVNVGGRACLWEKVVFGLARALIMCIVSIRAQVWMMLESSNSLSLLICTIPVQLSVFKEIH